MTIRITSFNAHKLKRKDRGTPGWDDRVTTIKEIEPDILIFLEVVVHEGKTAREEWEKEASETIRAFADDCQLTAVVGASPGYPHGTCMAANRDRGWFTAIMWNPETVNLVEGSYRPYGAPDFWHGCTTASFKIGTHDDGRPVQVRVAAYHGDPIHPQQRAAEALRLKSMFRTTGGTKPGIIAGDFNSISAARKPRRWWQLWRRYYDAEPYMRQKHGDLEYQVAPKRIGVLARLFRQQKAERPTKVLLRDGYMVDAAVHCQVPWEPTVGHWEDGKGDPDPWGERRIDYMLVTRGVAPAIVAYRTHRSTAALRSSDHAPTYFDLEPAEVTEEP
ncbi:endonuclease/exonuclease/phosphatase family protein [Streptomyces sp. NPDC004376]